MAENSAPETFVPLSGQGNALKTEPVASGDDSNAAPAPQAFLSSSKVTVGKFEIDVTRPLATFAHRYADAYECTGSDTGVSDHVAIVTKDRYPIRQDYADILISNNTIPRIMELRTRQVVPWPDDTQRCVLIFRRPQGQPLIAKHKQKADPLNEEIIKKSVIRPLVQTLRGLSHVGLFHGNIRPDTIFLSGQDNAEATLAECISSLPGINQPVTYETVERAMAHPQCRGNATVQEDIYALGVTVAVLLRGMNPLQGKSDTQILEDKLNFGSYVIFVDGLRLAPGLNEFLRGTLNDDTNQRWGLEQINTWLEGNRTTTKLGTVTPKAQRALEFNGKKYTRPRLLAKDLHQNVTEAVELIESGQMLKWVERAINDQNLFDALNAAIQHAHTAGRSAGFEDRLLCFVSMALDPLAPIRYKELCVFPNGIGYGLAHAFINNQSMQTYAELIRDRYGWFWLHYKENFTPRFNTLMTMLDQASKMVIRRGICYGLERCLYELCPDAPCMSDMLKDYYVVTCNGLLQSLNHTAERYMNGQSPLDRHVASFIVTQDLHDNAGFLNIVDGTDVIRRSLAVVTLFQQLQKRHDNPKLENFCRWLGKDAEIIIQRFHDQQLKKTLLKYLPKEIKTGDLTRILSLIDNPMQVKKDINEFAMAGEKYQHYNRERENIRMQLEINPRYGFESGQQVAMIISLLISGIMIAATLLIHFGK